MHNKNFWFRQTSRQRSDKIDHLKLLKDSRNRSTSQSIKIFDGANQLKQTTLPWMFQIKKPKKPADSFATQHPTISKNRVNQRKKKEKLQTELNGTMMLGNQKIGISCIGSPDDQIMHTIHSRRTSYSRTRTRTKQKIVNLEESFVPHTIELSLTGTETYATKIELKVSKSPKTSMSTRRKQRPERRQLDLFCQTMTPKIVSKRVPSAVNGKIKRMYRPWSPDKMSFQMAEQMQLYLETAH